MLKNINLAVQAIRPRTLPASMGPVFIGAGLAGNEYVNDNVVLLIGSLACAMLLQISANLVNDYYDHKNNVDSTDRIGPMRLSASGMINSKYIKLGYTISLLLSAIIGLFLAYRGGWPILGIGVLSIIIAYLYTGGPYPLSYIGLGEILAFLFFGPIAVWGTNYLLTGNSSTDAIIVGIGPGATAWALMGINNMRDQKSDKKHGKITMAVRFGEKASRIIPLVGIVISVLMPIYLAVSKENLIFILVSGCFLVFLNSWSRIKSSPIDRAQNLSLAATGKYITLYCLVLSGLLFLY